MACKDSRTTALALRGCFSPKTCFLPFNVSLGLWGLMDERDTSENEDLWSLSPNVVSTPVGLLWRIEKEGFRIPLTLQERVTLEVYESNSEKLM